MNNEELRDINEIKPAGNPIKAITYKPFFACYVCIAAGIGMLLLRQWAFLILGAIFIISAGFVLLKIKDRKVLDFYQDGVRIFGTGDDTRGLFVRFDDLKEWTTKTAQGGSEAVYFLLNNGVQIYKDTFQSSAAYRELIKLQESKESEHIRMEKMKGQPFSFKNVLNIFKRKK